MSNYTPKENSGSIFKNDYKKDGTQAPDYKGTANVNGKIMDMALWVAETKTGKKYFNIKFQEPKS